MDSYEAECALARRRISELGRDPDDFSVVMSLLPPDPDADRKLQEMTIWHWLKSRKQRAGVVEAPSPVGGRTA